MNIKKVGCPCAGCMRKADKIIETVNEKIDSLKWEDEKNYHPASHHLGYLKAIKDIKRILGVDVFWSDLCSCNICILRAKDV